MARIPLIGVNSTRTRITDRIPFADPIGKVKEAGIGVGAAVLGTAAVGTAGMVQSLGWPAFLTTLAEDAGLAVLVAV